MALAIPGMLIASRAVAGTPIYLSTDPPKVQIDKGPSLSLGRVGLDPCPGGLCRTEPQSNLYYFMTKAPIRSNRCPAFSSEFRSAIRMVAFPTSAAARVKVQSVRLLTPVIKDGLSIEHDVAAGQ